MKSKIKLRGFARMQIGETDAHGHTRIVGDSGWIKNTLTSDGMTNYLVGKLGALAGSKTISHLALASSQTQTINTAVTSLTSEVLGGTVRKSVGFVSTNLSGSTSLQMTAVWSSSDNTVANTIGAIAVYNTSAGGSLASIATFATSQWNTNQALSATYNWQFA